MLIKLSTVESVSSEHPLYPATNLLDYNNRKSWRCAKPNELMASVILQLGESAPITGIEIGNYRSCIVVVEATSENEPNKWYPIINYQFMTHDEAVNNKFRDQVQIFTKKDLNPDILNIKFVKLKITCMQSANPREIFGLQFIVLRTEVIVDLGLDIFGRFKLKEKNQQNEDEFKEKYLKLFGNKQKNYKEELKEKIIEEKLNKIHTNKDDMIETGNKDALSNSQASNSGLYQNISHEESIAKTGQKRTLFGDVIPDSNLKKTSDKNDNTKKAISPKQSKESGNYKINCCLVCSGPLVFGRCKSCNLTSKPNNSKPSDTTQKTNDNSTPTTVTKENSNSPKTKKIKIRKDFNKLFEDVSFALSGYVNPLRDEIRSKALKMGAKYVANPDPINNKCSYLICAFKNTPKSQQLKGHCKIVTDKFIEECYNKRKRIPWRRYAIDKNDRKLSDSEEEIDGVAPSLVQAGNPYDQPTDESDADY